MRGPHITPVDVMRATDFILPAIEVVDRRYTRRAPGPLIVDSVADGAWCGRVVVGSNPQQLTQIDVREIAGTLLVNGETRAHGFSSAVIGNLVFAVVWLANKLGEFGVALKEGHIVMSGSFTSLIPVHAHSPVVASFDGLGHVHVHLTQ